jgi:DNA transposition AAA+ family ATPase
MKELRMNKIFDQYVTPTRRAFYKLEQMGEMPEFVLEAERIFERHVREMERLMRILKMGQRYTLSELDQMVESVISDPSTLSRARIVIIRGQRKIQLSYEAEQLLVQIKKNILAIKAVREAQFKNLMDLREHLISVLSILDQLSSSF